MFESTRGHHFRAELVIICRSCREIRSVEAGELAVQIVAPVLVSSYRSPVLGSLTIVILAVVILRFRTITI